VNTSIPRYVLLIGLLAGIAGLGTYSLQHSVATGQPTLQAAALVARGSPTLGTPDAKVQIVEFLDPACEGCRAFYPVVKEILAQNPGKLRLVMRHVYFHKGADFAVKVLEASRKQGKYWETLDALFANQSSWAVNHTAQPKQVLAIAAGLGLNMQQLERDMNSPEVAQAMAQDMADAKTLKVQQTPDFYINGKRLDPFGVDQLRMRVREEVAAAYR
jgi:protein-disulfide isomerase